MSHPESIKILRDYIERSTHWKEGGATRHDALIALKAVEAQLEGYDQDAEPVGSILKANLKAAADGAPWCREVLLYSPNNIGDTPSNRVMLYTAGRLSDALDWAEKGLAEWRANALEKGRHLNAVQATARIAIGHLQAVLNKARTFDEQQKADTAARDWLTSIGSEPS